MRTEFQTNHGETLDRERMPRHRESANSVNWGSGWRDHSTFGSAYLPADISQKGSPIPIEARAFHNSGSLQYSQVSVIVTSEKELKWRPAVDFTLAFMRSSWSEFSERDVHLQAVKTNSGVPEQPIGSHSGITGANGRADNTHVLRLVQESLEKGRPAIVVSFENYIGFEQLDTSMMPEIWQEKFAPQYVRNDGFVAVDRPAILVRGYTDRGIFFEVHGVGDGVTIPYAFVDRAKDLNPGTQQALGCETTAGDLLHSELGCSSSNWHREFVGVDRAIILREGLMRLLPGHPHK